MARTQTSSSVCLADRFRRELVLAGNEGYREHNGNRISNEDVKKDLLQRMLSLSESVKRTSQKLSSHRDRLTPLESVMKAPYADDLARKGFTVRQLLQFYDHYYIQGKIKKDTKTEDIVRDIILPETCDAPSCYMDSNFMQQLGGAQRATKLVSHAWVSHFSILVLNIVLDALEGSRIDLVESLDHGPLDTPYFDRKRGVLSALKLLKDMPTEDLDKKYWLCIFAVNQHYAICGECPQCKDREEWKMDLDMNLRASPCLICGKKKYMPMPYNATPVPKHFKLDPWFELDLFPLLLERMDGLVVSLDPFMKVTKRAWVVYEIGEAAFSSTVTFRCALGVSRNPALKKLLSRMDFLDSIGYCESTLRDDKVRILREVRKRHGDIQSHDRFFNVFFELHFGRLTRLPNLSEAGLAALAQMTSLEMNYSWHQKLTSSSLTTEVGDPNSTFAKFKQLGHLVVNFERCWDLEALSETFMQGVTTLESLRTFAMSFRNCRSLASVDALGNGLAQLQAEFLASMKLSFASCTQLASVNALGSGIGNFPGMQMLSLNFQDCCMLSSVDELGVGLAKLRRLTSLNLNFSGCKRLTNVDAIGKALSQLEDLISIDFNFYECEELASVDELGLGLAGPRDLKTLALRFGLPGETPIRELGKSRYDGFVSIDEIGKNISKHQALTSLTLTLPSIGITSIDELSMSLTKMSALDSLKLNLDGCTSISSFEPLRNALSRLHTLSEFELDLQHCTQLHSVLRKHFNSQEAVRKALSKVRERSVNTSNG